MVPGPTDQVEPRVIPLLQAKGYTVSAVQNPLTSLKCVAYLGGNPQLLLAPNSGRARHFADKSRGAGLQQRASSCGFILAGAKLIPIARASSVPRWCSIGRARDRTTRTGHCTTPKAVR